VQHVLDKITDTKSAKEDSASSATHPPPSSTQTDGNAIGCDPISLAQASVCFVRASSTCHVAFENIIKQGNSDSDFATAKDPDYQIRNVQLLCDMEE
jgi:hypothetical protein